MIGEALGKEVDMQIEVNLYDSQLIEGWSQMTYMVGEALGKVVDMAVAVAVDSLQ